MLKDALAALDQHLDALAYVALVVMLVAVAIHADHRYTQERNRNVVLERRIRSLNLVVRFQDAVAVATTPEPAVPVGTAELETLSVDAMIAQLGYCLTCHRLKAPVHFTQTDHLRLEDNDLASPRREEH